MLNTNVDHVTNELSLGSDGVTGPKTGAVV